MEQWWNDIFAGETEVLGENLPSATLSTTNPTWIDPGANPGLSGERPATNRLSHGTAKLATDSYKLSSSSQDDTAFPLLLLAFRETVTVFTKIQTKLINSLDGKNSDLLIVKSCYNSSLKR
jgi:hypothetical protein